MSPSIVSDAAVVWFPVSDIEQAVSFYRDTLGLTLDDQQEQWAELSSGSVRVGLNQAESPSGDGGGVLAFAPAGGFDAAAADLQKAGVEVETSDHPWGRIAAFRDPDGNALQLFAPKE